jgi:hypothetical protein
MERFSCQAQLGQSCLALARARRSDGLLRQAEASGERLVRMDLDAEPALGSLDLGSSSSGASSRVSGCSKRIGPVPLHARAD